MARRGDKTERLYLETVLVRLNEVHFYLQGRRELKQLVIWQHPAPGMTFISLEFTLWLVMRFKTNILYERTTLLTSCAYHDIALLCRKYAVFVCKKQRNNFIEFKFVKPLENVIRK